MKTWKKTWGIPLLILLVSLRPSPSPAQSIFFDDSDPQIMVLGNGTSYEIALFKLTGAISSIRDIKAGVELTSGRTFDLLWEADFTDGSFVRSTDYYPGEPRDFSYSWMDSQKTLILTYTPDPVSDVKVYTEVTIAANDSSFFDIQIHIDNQGTGIIQNVEFPKHINLELGQGDRAYFPFPFPGLMYGADFFDSGESINMECDYSALLIRGGNMFAYQLYNDTCIQTVDAGLIADTDPEAIGNYYNSWNYFTWIEQGASWTSQVNRFRIGQTAWEAVHDFRADNAIEDFPSVSDKLGENLDRYTRSPLYTYTFPHWDPPGYYYKDVMDQLKYYPRQGIILLSGFFPSECPTCSGYNPDYFPPESLLGTLEDFLDMIDSLKSAGFMIMLATNSNFWHSESQTALNLPEGLTVEDIAALDQNGNIQIFDHFGTIHFFITLRHPFVQQKLEEIFHDLFEVYGTDMIYDDAAPEVRKYNFNPTEISPVHNRQEWINYYKERSSYPIIPEGAFIPWYQYLPGVIGTNYEIIKRSHLGWDYGTDEGYWRPYPLLSSILNDKVIPYPSMGVFSENKDNISWSILFGCPFQVDLDEMSMRPYWIIEGQDGWIPVIHDFQGRVTSRTMGKRMVAYTDLEGSATRADYGDISILRNWDEGISYTHGTHAISPLGIYARSMGGDLEAGILTRYNGGELSPGDHYLIVETFSDSIEVRHPMGGATPVQITRPEGWTEGDQIGVYAITMDSIKGIVHTLSPGHIQFQLQEAVADTSRILKYMVLYGDTLQITSADPARSEAGLLECYPNPFSDRTRISYDVAMPGKVLVRVMDLSGKVVRILQDGIQDRGKYNTEWDGRNSQGLEVARGIYLISCSTAHGNIMNKIVRL